MMRKQFRAGNIRPCPGYLKRAGGRAGNRPFGWSKHAMMVRHCKNPPIHFGLTVLSYFNSFLYGTARSSAHQLSGVAGMATDGRPADAENNRKSLKGEIGWLKYVLRAKQPDRCFLVMEHEGAAYVGRLSFDDAIFCAQMLTIIQRNAGSHHQGIGDLDLFFTR
jgi:hypothetical protein